MLGFGYRSNHRQKVLFLADFGRHELATLFVSPNIGPCRLPASPERSSIAFDGQSGQSILSQPDFGSTICLLITAGSS